MSPSTALSLPAPDSSGGFLVSSQGQALPLVGARLVASARGGLAEVVLEQRFRNTAEVPLTVTYSFPLPADAAVGGYAFTVAGRRIVGEIDRRAAARERFEEALIEGRTSGLVEQERSSLFTQEIGNIPAGAELVASLTIDQPLRWLEEGQWEWRFPTTAAPRYLGAAGDVADAARIAQAIADGPLPARLSLELRLGDALAGMVESPSHRLRANSETVAFEADGGVPLDRDVVVRWRVARPDIGVSVDVGRTGPKAYGLLTITPPDGPRCKPLPRDLVVLLDTSGSMSGEPLAQARRVVSAMIDTLGDEDRLELIEFSSAPRRWRAAPVAASAAMRREALAWLAALQASGGTEMRTGILEALRPLRDDSQRQVVVVTDGLIGFEQEVVGAICRRLDATCRVHTVGVGSGINRSLTRPAARAGRGVEVLIGLGEDPERAARRLVARTAEPLLVELTVSGPALVAHAPEALPDLFARAPALIAVELRPEGGELTVRGRTRLGEWSQTITVPACAPDSGSRAAIRLFGRERIEDLETRVAAGEEHDAQIEGLGLAFQLSTRLTSWIAVSSEITVDPSSPTRRVRMPQELPHGMSVEGLGLRASAGFGGLGMDRSRIPRGMVGAMAPAPAQAAPPPGMPSAKGGMLSKLAGAFRRSLSRSEDDQEHVEGAAAEEVAAEPARERRIRGRITLRKGKTLAIELEAGEDLALSPDEEVELRWPDGRRSQARLRQRPPETVKAGQTIRLVIELAESEPVPSEVRVAGLATTLIVML